MKANIPDEIWNDKNAYNAYPQAMIKALVVDDLPILRLSPFLRASIAIALFLAVSDMPSFLAGAGAAA